MALRAGPRPLHRRGWKVRTGPGSLHPPVAAALARLARRPGGGVIADPFCGDGTIPVEVALADPAAHVLAADLDAWPAGQCPGQRGPGWGAGAVHPRRRGWPVRRVRPAGPGGHQPAVEPCGRRGRPGRRRAGAVLAAAARRVRPARPGRGHRRRRARRRGRPARARLRHHAWSRASGWPGGYPRSWSRRRPRPNRYRSTRPCPGGGSRPSTTPSCQPMGSEPCRVLSLPGGGLGELVAVRRGQRAAVDLLQLRDDLQRVRGERRLPLERVQHDPFQQVTQRHVQVLGQALEHLEQAAFDPDTGLHPVHCYHGTTVTRYHDVGRAAGSARPQATGRPGHGDGPRRPRHRR